MLHCIALQTHITHKITHGDIFIQCLRCNVNAKRIKCSLYTLGTNSPGVVAVDSRDI
jgi:hypothetical protein